MAKALEGAGVPCAILDPKLAGPYALPIEEMNKLPGCRQPKDQDIAEAKRLVEKHYPSGVDVEAAVRSVGNYVDRAMVMVDPGDLFSLVYTTDAGSNWGKWTDKKTDDLTAQGLRETNPEKRKQIYWDRPRHQLSGAPSAIPVAWVEGFHFVDKRLRAYKFAPTVYDNNTFTKVWLAQ